jgi:DNA polymerase III sliding clamp (beta) subunit (PCNA family)
VKITAPARDLAKAASAAAAASDDKSNIPILANLLLTADENVSFTGNNLEGSMTATTTAGRRRGMGRNQDYSTG